jgi:hypothetical protein
MTKTFTRTVDISYVLIFYVGFQGGRYYLENRIQELGFVIVLTLFAYGAIKLAMQRADVKWSIWFWTTPLILSYPMIISSVTYYLHTGSNVFYSFFAAREFLIIYLAPTIFFMYKLGYPIERLEKIFVISLTIIIINYLFFYSILDLAAMGRGSNLYISQQVTWDAWRGYRLKSPTTGIFIGTSYCLIMITQKMEYIRKGGVIILFSMLLFCWYILLQRTQIATIIVSFLVFSIMFSRPSRINLLIFSLPVVVLTILLFSGKFVNIFFEEDVTRKMTAIICLQSISENPLLGYGTASWKGISYTDIFGKQFYPSDIGLLGVGFKHGIIGVGIYLYILVLLMYRCVTTNWYYVFYKKKKNPLLMSLVIWLIGVTIKTILVPAFMAMKGLIIASFIIGLTACYRDKFLQQIKLKS